VPFSFDGISKIGRRADEGPPSCPVRPDRPCTPAGLMSSTDLTWFSPMGRRAAPKLDDLSLVSGCRGNAAMPGRTPPFLPKRLRQHLLDCGPPACTTTGVHGDSLSSHHVARGSRLQPSSIIVAAELTHDVLP